MNKLILFVTFLQASLALTLWGATNELHYMINRASSGLVWTIQTRGIYDQDTGVTYLQVNHTLHD